MIRTALAALVVALCIAWSVCMAVLIADTRFH